MATQEITMRGRTYTFTPGTDPELDGHDNTHIGTLTNSRGHHAGDVVRMDSGALLLLGGPSGISRDEERRALAALDTETSTSTETDGDLGEITFPAASAGHYMTVMAPVRLHDRIIAVAPHARYGVDYVRGVYDGLDNLSRIVRAGWASEADQIMDGIEHAACDCRTNVTTGRTNTDFCRVTSHRA